jgi:leucyl aminopeptidase
MKSYYQRQLSSASLFDLKKHQLSVEVAPSELTDLKQSGEYRLRQSDGNYPVLFIFLGQETDGKKYSIPTLLSNFSAQATRIARAQGYTHIGIDIDTLSKAVRSLFRKSWQADWTKSVLTGATLADYAYPKSSEKPTKWSPIGITLISKKKIPQFSKSVAWTEAIEASATFSRNISNEPANTLTPKGLAKRTQTQFQKSKGRVKVMEVPEIRKMGMELFLSVNYGSHEPARLIEINYQGKGNRKKMPKVALVGKGVTFDSGGYCLKPWPPMGEMKYDMCGASTVLGASYAAAALNLPIHLRTIVPATENLVNGQANKPSDVIKSMSGQTVEIDNTDAEGRLILADALTYISKWKPDYIIDVATLTGAVCIALGSPAVGIMGNDPRVIERLNRASSEVGERVWELPLFPEYDTWFGSEVADFKNIGNKREGGSSCAGSFLQRFIPEGQSWTHMDIAGVAWNNTTRYFYPTKGASAASLMTLVRFLENLS